MDFDNGEPDNWCFGTLPRSEESIQNELRDAYNEQVTKFKAEQRKQALLNRKDNVNNNSQVIFSETLEFSAGAIKQFPADNTNKYIPLFPYFYCKDFQKG